MPVTLDTYLPTYSELAVPDVEVSFPVLKAASLHMGKYCDQSYKEFMLCRSEYKGDPRPCLNDNKEVTRCSIEFLQKVKSNCNDVFTKYWNCVDSDSWRNRLSGCQHLEAAMDKCFEEKIGVSRPEIGFFGKTRIHDSARPKPDLEEPIPEKYVPPSTDGREPRTKKYPVGNLSL